ncbi:hypothetical protein DWW61_09695 [Limosilactobacillus fermentum]|nr:hypothetical protein DWW61_09695 [Limosilactobacillus fermentum]
MIQTELATFGFGLINNRKPILFSRKYSTSRYFLLISVAKMNDYDRFRGDFRELSCKLRNCISSTQLASITARNIVFCKHRRASIYNIDPYLCKRQALF